MESGGSRVMETELRASQMQSPVPPHHNHNNNNHNRVMSHPHSFKEESGTGEEELSSLPRHTKVVVTGNNRTKSILVGLQGVVKDVRLGGWHWLVLRNGMEVRLQRNELSVLVHPAGIEDEGDCDNSFCSNTKERKENGEDCDNSFCSDSQPNYYSNVDFPNWYVK